MSALEDFPDHHFRLKLLQAYTALRFFEFDDSRGKSFQGTVFLKYFCHFWLAVEFNFLIGVLVQQRPGLKHAGVSRSNLAVGHVVAALCIWEFMDGSSSIFFLVITATEVDCKDNEEDKHKNNCREDSE